MAESTNPHLTEVEKVFDSLHKLMLELHEKEDTFDEAINLAEQLLLQPTLPLYQRARCHMVISCNPKHPGIAVQHAKAAVVLLDTTIRDRLEAQGAPFPTNTFEDAKRLLREAKEALKEWEAWKKINAEEEDTVEQEPGEAAGERVVDPEPEEMDVDKASADQEQSGDAMEGVEPSASSSKEVVESSASPTKEVVAEQPASSTQEVVVEPSTQSSVEVIEPSTQSTTEAVVDPSSQSTVANEPSTQSTLPTNVEYALKAKDLATATEKLQIHAETTSETISSPTSSSVSGLPSSSIPIRTSASKASDLELRAASRRSSQTVRPDTGKQRLAVLPSPESSDPHRLEQMVDIEKIEDLTGRRRLFTPEEKDVATSKAKAVATGKKAESVKEGGSGKKGESAKKGEPSTPSMKGTLGRTGSLNRHPLRKKPSNVGERPLWNNSPGPGGR